MIDGRMKLRIRHFLLTKSEGWTKANKTNIHYIMNNKNKTYNQKKRGREREGGPARGCRLLVRNV